eukprot:m.402395 g.402395  ORF g.402395 m.402395 type:complete len:105 (-) comp21178_c0_seq3:647-961(-)
MRVVPCGGVWKCPGAVMLRSCAREAGVDGVDLSALVANPVADAPPTAFHQYPACGCADGPEVCFHTARIACNNVPRTEFNYMGYSLRNAEWRWRARRRHQRGCA